MWQIGISSAATIKVAAIQYRALPLNKTLNIRHLEKLTSEAARNGAGLIVLPEMSTTGLNLKGIPDAKNLAETIPGPTTDEFAHLSKKYNVYIVIGLPEFDQKNNKYYNTQIVIDPAGKIIGKYRKIHLYGSDHNWASKGNLGYKIVEANFGKIGLGICYDINFPDLLDFLSKQDIDIFAFSTNWIADALPFSYWSKILQDRHFYFIAANNWGNDDVHYSGGSIILSPELKVLTKSERISNDIIYAQIELKNKAKKILLSGFEPFDGFPVNSSWEAIQDFDNREINGYQIKSIRLPVEYAKSVEKLFKAIDEYEPDIIVSFGLAPDEYIRLEEIARNHVGNCTDNGGSVPSSELISRNAPSSYASRLPLGDIYRALLANNIEVDYSTDAGDYVCNYLFYNLMARGDKIKDKKISSMGFIHVPPIGNNFPLEKLKSAVDIILQQVTRQD